MYVMQQLRCYILGEILSRLSLCQVVKSVFISFEAWFLNIYSQTRPMLSMNAAWHMSRHTFPPSAHSFQDDQHQSHEVWRLKSWMNLSVFLLHARRLFTWSGFQIGQKQATIDMRGDSGPNGLAAHVYNMFLRNKPMTSSITRYLAAFFHGLVVKDLNLGLLHDDVSISQDQKRLSL